MVEGVELLHEADCFDLCDILRLHLTTYYDYPINAHVMKDGSGDLFGCICNDWSNNNYRSYSDNYLFINAINLSQRGKNGDRYCGWEELYP